VNEPESYAEIRYSYPLDWRTYAALPELDFPFWLVAIDHNPFIALATWSLPRSKRPQRIALVVQGPIARSFARFVTSARYGHSRVVAFTDEGAALGWLRQRSS
jgi:hypothetical protein